MLSWEKVTDVPWEVTREHKDHFEEGPDIEVHLSTQLQKAKVKSDRMQKIACVEILKGGSNRAMNRERELKMLSLSGSAGMAQWLGVHL